MSKETEEFSKERQALDELYDVAGNIKNLKEDYIILKNMVNRLESIDNSNPSEALELLGFMGNFIIPTALGNKHLKDFCDKEFAIIKQALLKAQEPKQYLKWEDLEFNHTPKYIDVKMNDNKYKLVVGYNVVGKNLAILRDGKKEYYFLECDKQLFNDLHLERVEE